MSVAANTVVDGRYRIVNRVGTGGMADVYCAEDTHLGRKVALKILHGRFAQDEEFVRRFHQEASSAAGLQHPNVVGVFDRGEFDGTYYIAMEFLEGRNLKEVIRGGMEVEAAVAVVRQILAAARFAHRRNIVHRDLKPHNVIVDDEGRAKVTDFGIARAGASDMTQTGSIMGTAQYLSPEQAQGLPVTASSDIYSVGVILYEALAGRVPFEGDSAVAVALKQVSEVPVPPSQINPGVPPALDAVVMRALAKDPTDRFSGADEFLAELEYAAAHPQEASVETTAFQPVPDRTQVRPGTLLPPAQPPPAPPPPPPAQPQDRRRFRWWMVPAALLAMALVALLVLVAIRPDKVTVPRVIGQPANVATQSLEAEGFNVALRTVNSGVERDTVLEQDPPPGRRINEASTVVLTVSAGPGRVEVPELEGLTERVAKRRLEDEELEADVERRFSDEVEEGRVIESDPEDGDEVRQGSTVTIVVSKGQDLVEVPDVVGRRQAAAETAIRNAGLVPNTVERDGDEPEGEVIEAQPGTGSQVKRGSEVTLFVSTGEGSIKIADVVGRSRQRATDILHQQGLRVGFAQEPVDSPSRDGLVTQQTPSSGSRAKKGDRVTITIGRFQPPEEPGLEP